MKSGTILSAALLLTSGAVSADDILWAATISPDGRTTVDIVDATEAGCNAQLAQLANAVVVEACHVESAPLRITDPNDANKSTRTVRPRR